MVWMQLRSLWPSSRTPAKRGDLDVQIAVFDGRFRPDRRDDIGSRDDPSRPFYQHAENPERARTDRERRENPRSSLRNRTPLR